MSRTTSIEWTEHTWNPFVGCSRVSPGCVNCYAIPIAERNANFGSGTYDGTTERDARGQLQWTGVVKMASHAQLMKPATLPKQGALVFVNSMSDFWHEGAEAWMRERVMEIIRKFPQHAFQVLTKRPQRIAQCLGELETKTLPDNFWLGCTVEDQKRANERIPHLVAVRANVRFLSVEPLLERVSLKGLLEGIHWVIVGGESGPHARSMSAEWVEQLRDECHEANVPFFFKQYGTWRNNPLANDARMMGTGIEPKDWVTMRDPNGKGGSKLDGFEVKQFPRAWRRSVSSVQAALF